MSSSFARGKKMLAQSRFATAVALCSLALFAFQGPLMADTLDRRLIGAWTTSKENCAKTFQRSKGALSYRPPLDLFAQAFIVQPSRITTATAQCSVRKVTNTKDGATLDLYCNNSIGFSHLTVRMKVLSDTELLYRSGTSTSLEIPYDKCSL
jgi:hypothetical protein